MTMKYSNMKGYMAMYVVWTGLSIRTLLTCTEPLHPETVMGIWKEKKHHAVGKLMFFETRYLLTKWYTQTNTQYTVTLNDK